MGNLSPPRAPAELALINSEIEEIAARNVALAERSALLHEEANRVDAELRDLEIRGKLLNATREGIMLGMAARTVEYGRRQAINKPAMEILRDGPVSEKDLAAALDRTPKQVRRWVNPRIAAGHIQRIAGKLAIISAIGDFIE